MFTLTIFFVSNLRAQDPRPTPTSFDHYFEDGAYIFDDAFKLSKTDMFTTYKSMFGLTDDDEMVLDEEIFLDFDLEDLFNLGTWQSRYKQYHKGFLVEGKLMNVASKCDVALIASGDICKGLDVDTTDVITDSVALDSALAFISSQFGYLWEDSLAEALIKEVIEDSTITYDSTKTYYPKGQLIIARKYGLPDSNQYYKLCWQFNINYFDTSTTAHYDTAYTYIDSVIVNKRTDSAYTLYDTTIRYAKKSVTGSYEMITDTVQKSLVVYIDAQTGAVHTSNDFTFGWASGNVWTPYEGYRTNEVETSVYGVWPFTSFRLRDGRKIETMKSQPVGNFNNTWSVFSDQNNDWLDNTETKNAASAHWGVERAYDFFANKGIYYQNKKNIRFWDFSGSTRYVGNPNGNNTLGDDVISVAPLSSAFGNGYSHIQLDVMAHEYTHSILYRTTGLGNDPFYYPDSRALAEGFCDIMGLAVEASIFGCDWSVGEKVGIKRNFFDPWNDYDNAHGSTPHTATYNDGLFLSSNDAYNRSGVLRRWFNVFSQGLTPTFDGAGFQTAENLSFITMMWWLWQNAGFHDARNQTFHVCTTHFDAVCSPTWRKLAKAWSNVGLPTNLMCKPIFTQVNQVLKETQVGNTEEPAVFQVGLGDGASGIRNLHYSWILPSTWVGHYNSDTSIFTLDSVDNYESKPITVIANYRDASDSLHADTITNYIHFSDVCNTGLKQPNSNNSSHPSVSNINTQDDGINVFPNPNEGTFVISGKFPENEGIASVVVTNISGMLVLKDNARITNGYISKTIQLDRSLPAGIYFVKLISNSKNSVIKIIKN